MRRSRRSTVKPLPPASDSEDETTAENKEPNQISNGTKDVRKPLNLSESSSDESDIELYLKPANKLDLSSSFFTVQKPSEPSTSFENIEKSILSGVTRLSDSDSAAESDDESQTASTIKPPDIEEEPQPTTSNFHQLTEYEEKIEEARKHAEQYLAKKKKALDTTQDISNLLSLGEGIGDPHADITLHSSDFESCDSEQDDWEEIKSKEKEEKKLAPTKGVEIVVNMPDTVRKKTKTDFMSAMKRRLNRIRKENQVYVHKVHLLSWISHGLYVNSCINSPEVLAMALSLLPSEQCYPSDRCDMKYLEGILKWYKKTVHYTPDQNANDLSLENALKLQMNRKEAFTTKAWVLIFVAILRALGIQCRVVYSFVVEPIRPPASELHSLSAKNGDEKKAKVGSEGKSKEAAIKQAKKGKAPVKDAEKNKAKPSAKPKVEEKKNETPGKSGMKEKEDQGPRKEIKQQPKREATVKEVQNDKIKIKENQEKRGRVREIKRPRKRPVTVKEPEKQSKPAKKVKFSENEEVESKSADTKPNLSKLKSQKEPVKRKPSPRARSAEDTKAEKPITENKKSSSKAKTESKESKPKESKIKPDLSKISKTTTKTKSPKEKIKIKLPERKKSRSPNPMTKPEEPIASETEKKSKTTLDGPDLQKLRRSTRTKSPVVPQTDGNYDESSDSDVDSVIFQLDGSNDEKPKPSKSKKSTKSESSPQDSKNSKRPLRKRTNQSLATFEYDSEDEFRARSPLKVKRNVDSPSNYKLNLKRLNLASSSKNSPLDVRNDIVQLIKGRISEAKEEDRHLKAKKRKPVSDHESSDSDFLVEETKKPKKSRASSSEAEKKKMKVDVWAEVFLEMEEAWISVDIVNGRVHCVKDLHSRATQPVAYVVAFNNDNSLKDITSRYCQNFNTVTRKLRVNSTWWAETIAPFLGPTNVRDKEEDDELRRQQLEKPLPTAIAECKNHPLYVLSRHLLKFEAIYPPDAATLGFVRKEPVYSRSCVYTLHSRDIWLKHAKVVKLGEKPYKIVKARPKYDKLSNSMITDQLLEIFGPWQVEDYVPPTAENGIVPRNAFGNVELFKECMLPKKTVHLQLPGLNKVAKRMNIDCAPAVVGFDYHGGYSHPTFDGYVVCEEFEDVLIAAWHIEQEESERKEKEKLEARVYGNWKKLIKGLLIRERLKARYDFGNPKEESQKKKKSKIKFCTKMR